MPRHPRIHYPGAIYHVMVRGNNQKDIFITQEDYKKYLLICREYLTVMPFYVLAYCLMRNHIHLLIEVDDLPLSSLMKNVQQRYTQYFNKKYDTSGHLFQGRYKALLVNKDQYLRSVISYIHCNPLKAGLESYPGMYPWTGHHELIKKHRMILDDYRMLSYFDSVSDYLQLLRSREQDSCPEFYYDKNVSRHRPSGNENQAAFLRVSLDDLLKIVSAIFCLDNEQCFLSKKHEASEARKVFIFFARHYAKIPGVEVSRYLETSQETVAKAYQYVLRRRYNEYKAHIEKVKEKVQNF